MPFTHNDDVHQQILNTTEFESDESYKLESEEEDKMLAIQIAHQNEILHTMQRTIANISKAL